MRILLVQDYFRNGGTERQTLFLARAFQEAGHEARLLVFRPGGRLAQAVAESVLPCRILQSFDSRICLWAPGLRRAVAEEAPDVILCMGRTANCYAGGLQRAFPGVIVVATLRTGKMIVPFHSWSLRQVRAVLVNSSWWKRRLLERNFPLERIHVVRNSLLLERRGGEAEARQALRQQRKVGAGTCVFLNVATFRRGKRHAELLRQVATMQREHSGLDWQLWLVGEGSEWRRCQRLANELGIAERVFFTGYQADPWRWYAAADVAVTLSMEDSLPNFLIEAQAMSLPVVAREFRGVRECLDPGKTGLVLAVGEEAAWRQAAARLAQDPGYRATLAEGASAHAAKHFSPQAQATAVREFLEHLARTQG